MTLLVVAATREEAAHVPPGFEVVVTGPGKTLAAAATARALAVRNPAGLSVVNIGTAGALRDGMVGLHLPGRVLNHDLSADVVRALATTRTNGWTCRAVTRRCSRPATSS